MYILSSSDNMARSPIYDALCSKWVQPFKSPKFLLFPFRDWSWHCLLSPLFCHHLNNPYWFCMVFQPRFEPSDLGTVQRVRKCMASLKWKWCWKRLLRLGLKKSRATFCNFRTYLLRPPQIHHRSKRILGILLWALAFWPILLCTVLEILR